MKETVENLELMVNELGENIHIEKVQIFSRLYKKLVLCLQKDLKNNGMKLSETEKQNILKQGDTIQKVYNSVNSSIKDVVESYGLIGRGERELETVIDCLIELKSIQNILTSINLK